MYQVASGPATDDLDAWRRYIDEELQRIATAMQQMQVPAVQLAELHVVPAKPRDGLVVFADGTDWDPGSGRGVYVYSSSAWVKL